MTRSLVPITRPFLRCLTICPSAEGSLFQSFEDLYAGKGLCLVDSPCHPQPSLRMYHCRTPKLTALYCLWIALLSPLLPTYDHMVSNWPRSTRKFFNSSASMAFTCWVASRTHATTVSPLWTLTLAILPQKDLVSTPRWVRTSGKVTSRCKSMENHSMIWTTSTSMSVHSSAWGLNWLKGSRIKTQRSGTAPCPCYTKVRYLR